MAIMLPSRNAISSTIVDIATHSLTSVILGTFQLAIHPYIVYLVPFFSFAFIALKPR